MVYASNFCAAQKTILVVDDNESARWILAEILADEGYAVCEAASADEALQRLEERPDIRGIVSDIEMPGTMNGIEMAAIIRADSPKMAMLLTSGRHYPAVAALPPGVKFISKPWNADELLRELEAVLCLSY